MSNKVNLVACLAVCIAILSCKPSASTPAGDTTPPDAQAKASTTAQPARADPLIAAADKGRIEGDSTAKTWLIVASDFQCPFCKQWHDESYKAIYDEYVRSGKVKVAYVNFPLNQHLNAMPTAEAAMCAAAQGKFWQFHEALFATQQRWEALPSPETVLDSIAGVAGVDKPSWKQCVESGRMKPLIMADRNRAAAAGVQSTPSFILGTQVLAGALPLDTLRAALNAEIAKNTATH